MITSITIRVGAEIIGQMRDERSHVGDFCQQSSPANLPMVMSMPMTNIVFEMIEIFDDVPKFRLRGIVVSRIGEFIQSLNTGHEFVVHFAESDIKPVVSMIIRMHVLIGLPHGFHQPVRQVVNMGMLTETNAI